MTRVFIIGSVRNASAEYRAKLETCAKQLETDGHRVHLPHRDTDQTASSWEICSTNREAIATADEVHIFYSSQSQGSIFDMGIAFGLNKTIRLIETEPLTQGKSFANLLDEWSRRS